MGIQMGGGSEGSDYDLDRFNSSKFLTWTTIWNPKSFGENLKFCMLWSRNNPKIFYSRKLEHRQVTIPILIFATFEISTKKWRIVQSELHHEDVFLKLLFDRKKACVVPEIVLIQVKIVEKKSSTNPQAKAKAKLKQNRTRFQSPPISRLKQKDFIWAICICSKARDSILNFICSH